MVYGRGPLENPKSFVGDLKKRTAALFSVFASASSCRRLFLGLLGARSNLRFSTSMNWGGTHNRSRCCPESFDHKLPQCYLLVEGLVFAQGLEVNGKLLD